MPSKKQNSKIMKRQTLILVAFICALFSLSGCDDDTSSSAAWLKNTGWEANLDGYVLDGESISGKIRLFFRNGGYEFVGGYGHFNETWGTYDHGFRTESKTAPEYDFPKVTFNMTDGPEEAAVYNTGILSDDLKVIHFDTFKLFSLDGDEFKNIDFVRKK